MITSGTESHYLELWAGVECTVNRVGDHYFDQLERSGHATRASDLDLLASLGVRALRYPVLWERVAPSEVDPIDWTWVDDRLGYLSQLKIRPIVGLVHHGSGPRYTNLLDPCFAEKLAVYAGAVARRYPGVIEYTPVNEPLTTARFSALYGHWYPHKSLDLCFARSLLAQCRGIVLAMRAIREVNLDAKLVQTEDLGKTFSTPTLSYQADFENERRWLTYDLLCGRVTAGHPLSDYLRWLGLSEEELEWFVDNPCPPDVIGVNHYITSERFLDERTARYPTSVHGGNGHHAYADVEAVRVCSEGVAGPRVLMEEAWQRYKLPIAITEAHIGCTREEQLRWFKEIWEAASELHRRSIDVRAVTAWSAFGAFDWNSLLTRDDGHYEPGIFDLRSPSPRPTALAKMLRTLADGHEFDHPAVDSPGWWRRFDRLCYPAVSRRQQPVVGSVRGVDLKGEPSRPLLITGATGTLGKAFARICEKRGLAYYLLSRQELDIADEAAVNGALRHYQPWAVVNAAGYVRVDDAERETDTCLRENLAGPAILARLCAEGGVGLVTFSSDLVFDGSKTKPYVERDPVAPLNVYGKSKAEAEQRVLESFPQALVIRTSAFFGPWDHHNFASLVLNALSQGAFFQAANNITISPTYVPDLVNAVLDLLIDGESGTWHLANTSALTWAGFARMVAEKSGYKGSCIDGRPSESLGFSAARPAYSALASERGTLLPPIEDALDRYFGEQTRPLRRELNVKNAL
jgi:dTDP-4-dehydrorhamnose reductase